MCVVEMFGVIPAEETQTTAHEAHHPHSQKRHCNPNTLVLPPLQPTDKEVSAESQHTFWCISRFLLMRRIVSFIHQCHISSCLSFQMETKVWDNGQLLDMSVHSQQIQKYFILFNVEVVELNVCLQQEVLNAGVSSEVLRIFGRKKTNKQFNTFELCIYLTSGDEQEVKKQQRVM